MGLVKRAADLAYTFRFIRMLVMDWKNWDAYKEGLIDENGKRIKSVKMDTDAKKSSYTTFIRLAANTKRLLSKIPGGGSKLGSFAAGLFLIKEKYNLTDNHLDKILNKLNIDSSDILAEKNDWFVLKDKSISPGVYRIKDEKIINTTCEPMVLSKDQIKVYEGINYPVGDVFGMDIYEATHVKTNQKIYITTSEIYK
jgi:hypothetical protein